MIGKKLKHLPGHQAADGTTWYSWVKPVLALPCLSDPKALKSLPPHLLPCCTTRLGGCLAEGGV